MNPINKVLLAVLSLFSQLKKVRQAFPGSRTPKAFSGYSTFPSMLSTLPSAAFQIQRKILREVTNKTSTCCKPGNEVVEWKLVTIRQLFPGEELNYILIQDQTVLLLSSPSPQMLLQGR